MSTEETIQVVLRAPDREPARGAAQIRHFSSAERLRRATVRALAALVVTGVTVAIPLVHFISVPIGLIVTVIITAKAFGQESVIEGGEARCPYCGAAISLVRRPERYPFLERCGECSREATVEKGQATAGAA